MRKPTRPSKTQTHKETFRRTHPASILARSLFLFAAALALLLVSCSGLDRRFVLEVKASWELIEPYAREGIEKSELHEESKAIRLRHIDAHSALLEEAFRRVQTE